MAWRGRHNANLPDFFACQMTEPPRRVCGRNPWVWGPRRADRGAGTGVAEWRGRRGWYEKRALFGNNADTRLHPHLHSSP